MASDRFIYFDGAYAYGALNGVLQVELSANALNPTSEGAVELSIEQVARLRCSVAAARGLIDALTKAIEMAEKPKNQPPQAAKPN